VDRGVLVSNQVREPPYYGYSVGNWVDDTTLGVQTIAVLSDGEIQQHRTGTIACVYERLGRHDAQDDPCSNGASVTDFCALEFKGILLDLRGWPSINSGQLCAKRKIQLVRCRMKNKLLRLLALGVGLLIVCGPALAHHGSAAYANRMTELKQATVTKFLWSNPHSLLDFDVKDDQGNVVHWVAETGSPSAMTPVGWSKTSVQPGDIITVYIWPAKSGNPVGRLHHIVLPDGTVLNDTVLGGDKHPK
jgi:hypothetical protein